MNSQPDLFPTKQPAVTDAEVACLLSYLQGRGWRTAKQINHDLGCTERYLRALAHASAGRILSYPGSPGYRLTVEATLDEINKARCLLDQAEAMRAHWLAIERVRHTSHPSH